MKIEDNFLDQEEFEKLQKFMMGADIVWSYADVIVYEGEEKDELQFIHEFFLDTITSNWYGEIFPVIKLLDPFSISRIKANLRPRTSSPEASNYHVDMMASEAKKKDAEKLKQFTTAIFYMNTNNGYTEFEDGTKVESVANRMVKFPTVTKHRGISCTDEKIRVVINFNYI